MATLTYLHVRGVLYENMVYRPQLGFESSRPRRESGGDCEIVVVAIDSNGELLTTVPAQICPRGCGERSDALRYRVRACLPLHPDAVAYELRRSDMQLHRAPIESRPPTLTDWTCRARGRRMDLRWRSEHSQPLVYHVVADLDTGERISLARGLGRPGFKLNLAASPVFGSGRLAVIATDGVRSAELHGERFVGIQRTETLVIAEPVDGARLPFGQPISLMAYCFGVSGETLKPSRIEWLMDGQVVGDRGLLEACEPLAPGEHRIELVAHHGERELTATARFRVTRPSAAEREWVTLFGQGSQLMTQPFRRKPSAQ